MAFVSSFTISTATYTVADTFSYDLYYVDTSISNTAITITLPNTVANQGCSVQFKSVTSVLAGNTANNAVIIQTTGGQSINFTGITQIPLVAGTMISMVADETNSIWQATVTPEYVPAIYGDGSDGTVTETTRTLTVDMLYENLIVPNGVSLKTGGYRVFVRNNLTLQGTGNINNDGIAGGNGASGAGGARGIALTTTYFSGAGSGGNGASGSAAGSAAGTTGTTSSVGSGGGVGGATTGPVRAGGAGSTTVPIAANLGGPKAFRQVVNAVGGFLPTGVRFTAANGGGGGAGNAGTAGGGGGGSGAGILVLCARNILVTGTGSRISANGGAGGNGFTTNASSGGGGGGGGAVLIVTQTQNLTTNYAGILTVSTNGGTAGTGNGANSNPGVAGTAGTAPVVVFM